MSPGHQSVPNLLGYLSSYLFFTSEYANIQIPKSFLVSKTIINSSCWETIYEHRSQVKIKEFESEQKSGASRERNPSREIRRRKQRLNVLKSFEDINLTSSARGHDKSRSGMAWIEVITLAYRYRRFRKMYSPWSMYFSAKFSTNFCCIRKLDAIIVFINLALFNDSDIFSFIVSWRRNLIISALHEALATTNSEEKKWKHESLSNVQHLRVNN